MTRTKKTKIEVIAIDDLAHNLGLSETAEMRWIVENPVTVISDYRRRPSVPAEMIETLSSHPEYVTELSRSQGDAHNIIRLDS